MYIGAGLNCSSAMISESAGRGYLLCGRMHGNREYRLVCDWEHGACGTELHFLELRLGAVAVAELDLGGLG